MPPRIPQTSLSYLETRQAGSRKAYNSLCWRCASSSLASCGSARRRKRATLPFPSCSTTRKQSNDATQTLVDQTSTARNLIEDPSKLKTALNELQKHFRGYVNLSRLQLALRALEQKPGQETIRIAILALNNQVQSLVKVRELVRLLFADPLKEEEEWERALIADPDPGKPVLLRIGKENNDSTSPGVNTRLIQEFSISSPTLNSHRLEILVMEVDNLSNSFGSQEDLSDAILVPSVDIPVSSTGKYTPVTTPVHKALLVGDGISGAAALMNLTVQAQSEIISCAVDLSGISHEDQDPLPIQVADILLAKSALASFRTNTGNALAYEHDWSKSNVPNILKWITVGTSDTPGYLKSPVRALIASVLADTNRRIEYEKSRQLSALLSSRVSTTALESLQKDLDDWAQHAHTELRDQLDIAFEGRRWRNLSWWKLFWRVDDVSMIASDILYQRFLSNAEKEITYLSGKIEGTGVLKAGTTIEQSHWAYKPAPNDQSSGGFGSLPSSLSLQDAYQRPQDDSLLIIGPQPWPLHIPSTRLYLSTETVPALQALGQRLVLQTLTTSSFASAFAGLIYMSSLSLGLYEAGAVAAFGIVWGMRRMQKKWETARSFWEGEVREEGRKAIRATEGTTKEFLAVSNRNNLESAEEFETAIQAVEKASKALKSVSKHPNKPVSQGCM